MCPVSVDLPILDISDKWNHTLCGLLCLAAFTEENVSTSNCSLRNMKWPKRKVFK